MIAAAASGADFRRPAQTSMENSRFARREIAPRYTRYDAALFGKDLVGANQCQADRSRIG
jgi:hypothetical protein